jgi:Tfp pilus assembly protein FimT
MTLCILHPLAQPQLAQPQRVRSGYTLVELMIILGVSSLLAALTVPSMMGSWQRQKLTAAQDEVMQALVHTQSLAKQERVDWQTSFRLGALGTVEWAQHRGDRPATTWQSLSPGVVLDTETTIPKSQGVYRVKFDERGRVVSRLGRITLKAKSGGSAKSCVIVSTLLGKLRTGVDNVKPRDDKYCY